MSIRADELLAACVMWVMEMTNTFCRDPQASAHSLCDEGFLSVTFSMPIEGANSNRRRRWRCESHWLLRRRSLWHFPWKRECRVPASGGWIPRTFGHGPTLNRPSRPVVRPPLRISHLQGRSDMRGCEGRLRSSMCSKLLSISPTQAGNFSFICKRTRRTSAGQPMVFAAPAPSPIRVRALDRHGNGQRQKSFAGKAIDGITRSSLEPG
jgi:hypothetical protein